MQVKRINDFRMRFSKIYHNQVVPVIKNMEQDRLLYRNIAFIVSSLVFIVIAFFIYLALGRIQKIEDFLILFAMILGMGGISSWTVFRFFEKRFERKVKTRVMPIVMPAFGDFIWTANSPISDYEIRESQLYTRFEKSTEDDNFIGSYNGVPIKLTETKLTYETIDSKGRRRTHVEFRGVLISLELPKKFTGHTIVTGRSFLNLAPYNEVKLEDPEFSKQYYVSSTDQVEARYLLTAAFIQRFKNLKKVFNAGEISCSFLDNKLLIALSVYKDLFSLGSLTKPVTDTTQFTVFLNEIIAIFEIIEELKLYEDTGL